MAESPYAAKTREGLVAQQELDEAQAKDLECEAQVSSASSALSAPLVTQSVKYWCRLMAHGAPKEILSRTQQAIETALKFKGDSKVWLANYSFASHAGSSRPM